MATSISSCSRSSGLGPADISDAVSSIPWIQLVVFQVMFSSCIRGTASWPHIRRNGKYPVLRLTVTRLAQITAG